MIKYFLETVEGLDLRFERRTDGAAGYDLMANIGMERELSPGTRFVVRTGLYLEMPPGIEAQIRSRSGLALQGVTIAGGIGTVDWDYRGEISVTLINLDRDRKFVIVPGARVAQLVFSEVLGTGHRCMMGWDKPTRVAQFSDLSDTTRGSSGFGSTGV